MFNDALNCQCDVLADCFVLAGKNGWDTDNFIQQLFTTSWGVNILTGKSENEFTCESFMYEGLCRELSYNRGATLPESILWYLGYLYRYLCDSCDIISVYQKVTPDIISKRYGFYHTQDFDYVKHDLGLD